MKKVMPEQNGSYKQLNEILTGGIRERIMIMGLELGIFQHLSEPIEAVAVAQKAGLHPANTGRLLDSLATIGLVIKEQGRYQNQERTQTFLAPSSPTYIGDLMLLMHKASVAGLDQALPLIEQGPGAAGENDFAAEELWAGWAKASASWAFGEVGHAMAGIVSRLPGFAGFERMMDLGGGHGAFALYFLEAHPTMRAVVFDRPAVLEVAKSFAQKFGLDSRLETRAGDYLQDDIGQDFDLIFASATLNFAKGRLEALVEKIYAALKPGGYFMAFQDGMTHERTQPEVMLGHLSFALTSEDDFVFDQGEIAEAMLGAGFKQVRSRTIGAPMGAMDLDIARK